MKEMEERYFKLGDEVFLKGKIVEIIDKLDSSYMYKIKFNTPSCWYSEVLVDESQLIEKEGVV